MEKLICSNQGLSTLDETLNAAYRNALDRTTDKSTLRRSQRTWLSSYDVKRCTDARCVQDVFSQRILVLDSLAGAGMPGMNWTGHFVRYRTGREDTDTASITVLALEKGRLHLTGDAIWLGADPGRGTVNTGELAGYAVLQRDGTAWFESDGCTARLRLRDGGLQVSDESGCGGMNVTFNGVYRRK